jgi:uncharacterized protein YggU (UPF0235/DUF167 family)
LPDAPHPHWLRTGSDFVTIEIVARPGSRRHGLLRVEPRGLVIGIASAAEKGKANDELIVTIAKIAEVPRGEVSILRGATARGKVVRIATAQPAAIAQRLLIATSEAK